MQRRSLIAKLVIKFFGALICSVLLWELILECFVVRSPGSQTHSILGRLFTSGLLVHGTEGFSVTHINALGMRNGDIQPKATGVYRVLMLGDSFTEGYQVGDSHTFSALTEHTLQRKFGAGIEVVNGGRSGGSPAYYIHLADFYRERISPDFVVVQLDQGDFTVDLLNSNKYFAVAPDGGTFKTIRNSAFVSDNPFTQRFPRLSFLTSISTLRVASEKVAAMRGKPGQEREGGGENAPLTSQGREAMRWAVAALHRKYPNLLLVFLPNIDYDHPTLEPFEVESLLGRYANEAGVPLIDMRPDFVNGFLESRQPPLGFYNTQPGVGHINELGHSLVASRISGYLAMHIRR